MSLRPVKRKPRLAKFLTFDLEWSKGREIKTADGGREYHPEVRMAGVFDGHRFRWYKTINAFLDGELTKENRGKRFYAHAGGLADMLFVLEKLADRPEFRVSASFSGSSAIIVRVSKGKHSWVFCDSLWLLKGSLAEIGKVLGMQKGDVHFDESSMEELIEYNEQDCRILWEAINRFENEILELGGELRMTLASCAMFLFRKKYLKREIYTNSLLNERSRKSYFASRVELFEYESEEGCYFDINSSFPYAMTKPCPGSVERTSYRIIESRLSEEEYIFLADVEVEVPEMYLPPLPFRHKTSVYFPTGRWRSWFTNIDIELLLRKGGKIHAVHKVIEFEPIMDLADYAHDLYNKRMEAKEKGWDFSSMTYKILLNSLYGKFAEDEHKQELLLHPESTPCTHEEKCPIIEATGRPECVDMLFPGAFLRETNREIPHAHVPLSAHITSRARATLYDHMDGNGPLYCDTDGFGTPRKDLHTSPELGGLKLEYHWGAKEKPLTKDYSKNRARFVRPKVYQIGDKVRAKGFTLKPDYDTVKKMSAEEVSLAQVRRFEELIAGQPIEMMRFSRIRELYRKGLTVPTERIVTKQLQGTAIEKRKRIDNTSRPWTINEIRDT